jgi:16S rRNA (cytosine1402-N4)-methyltransferase
MLDEVITHLDIKPGGIYVDGTLGGAGHAFEVCKRLGEDGRFVGIDQDADAIAASTKRLQPFGDKVRIVRSNYSDMAGVLKELGISKVDGITLDLGVSSYQLDNEVRGFTYREDAPLDMRMDDRQEITAETVVNEYTKEQLAQVIAKYGEDKFARNIAKHIVEEREKEPIRTTGRLAEIVDGSIPMKFKKQGGHPAKRTFQAIRIEVNQELGVLENNIGDMIDLLAPGGRFCIITFHSLEDRIVKNAFRQAQDPCVCPPDFPVCVCGRQSKGKVLTRKPLLPSEQEMTQNPRSKSAKLRVFEHK